MFFVFVLTVVHSPHEFTPTPSPQLEEITNYFFIDKIFSKVSDVDNSAFLRIKKDIYGSGELVGEMTDEALLEKSKFYNEVILRNTYLIKKCI